LPRCSTLLVQPATSAVTKIALKTEARWPTKIARRWNMGSRYQLSVEANGPPAHFLPDSFSRESLVVNVSCRFERGG
jgi:hypothetical protein